MVVQRGSQQPASVRTWLFVALWSLELWPPFNAQGARLWCCTRQNLARRAAPFVRRNRRSFRSSTTSTASAATLPNSFPLPSDLSPAEMMWPSSHTGRQAALERSLMLLGASALNFYSGSSGEERASFTKGRVWCKNMQRECNTKKHQTPAPRANDRYCFSMRRDKK